MIHRFGIYSPSMGQREDIPNILMNKAFTRDNTNVQIWEGEVRTAKLRKKELYRQVFTIDSISTTGETIRIDGDHTSQFPNGSTVVVYDADDNYEQFTLSTTASYVGGKTVLTVTGDITASTPDGFIFNDDGVASSDPANTDFLKVGSPDGEPFVNYFRLIMSDLTERLVGFTNSHIYYWDASMTNWSLVFTSAGTTDYWSIDQYGDYIVATNNIDRPIKWDGDSATTFSNLDTQYATTADYISKAKFIKSYNNYLFLGNVELSNGNQYNHDVYWSSVGEGVTAGGFRQDLTGDASYATVEGTGEISGGFGTWEGYLIVFKRWSIRKMWNVTAAIPFQQDNMYSSVGCVAPGSVINNADGELFFYGSDKSFRNIRLGEISQGINTTARNINPDEYDKIRATFIDEYGELWWSIPSGSGASDNNKIVVYKGGKWQTDIDIAVPAFGKYSRQTNYTWDTLPFGTWDTWGWASWDAVDGSVNFPIDLCSDADGYTYEVHGAYTDNGSAYTSSFVITTDLADKKALPIYKRLLQIYVYCRNAGAGTLNISIKRDNETTWQSQGSISLSGNEDILRQRLAVDARARHFLIKLSGTDAFNVIGLEFEFLPSGDR